MVVVHRGGGNEDASGCGGRTSGSGGRGGGSNAGDGGK